MEGKRLYSSVNRDISVPRVLRPCRVLRHRPHADASGLGAAEPLGGSGLLGLYHRFHRDPRGPGPALTTLENINLFYFFIQEGNHYVLKLSVLTLAPPIPA